MTGIIGRELLNRVLLWVFGLNRAGVAVTYM